MTSSLYRGRPRSCAFFKIHWWDLPTTLGSNTWFSSLESKLIHPNIFPQFIWISRVSWNQFYWLQFDSSFQPYVALFSMCMSHWEQSWVSSTTQFLPCVFGACHSTENEFCKGQRRFEPSRGEWGRKLKAQRTIIYNLNLWPKNPQKMARWMRITIMRHRHSPAIIHSTNIYCRPTMCQEQFQVLRVV